MNKEILLRYLDGEASSAEKNSVAEWLDQDENHMKEFLSLRKIRDISTWNITEPLHPPIKKSNATRAVMLTALKIAAALIPAILVTLYFTTQKTETLYTVQEIYVPAGQRAEIKLTDGSKVWLNANSKFSFRVNSEQNIREASLNGEGYFVVAKDKKLPFVVKTENFQIRAIGTEFDVLAWAGKAAFETSLFDGSVEISRTNSEKGYILEPGKRFFMDGNKTFISGIEHSNYFLWKDGIISFNDEPFPEMARKLELYFDLKIVIENSRILKFRCTGKFRSKDGVEHILKVLQLSNKFSYTINDKLNQITIK